MDKFFVLSDLDFGEILKELSSGGATFVSILDEDFRMALLKEAEGYHYRPEDETLGSGDRLVRQEVSSSRISLPKVGTFCLGTLFRSYSSGV